MRQDPASYASPSLAQRLLKAAADLLPDHIPQVYENASLAGLILHHCNSTPANVSLKALAMAHQANAVRVQGDLVQAQNLMDTANFLMKSAGDEGVDPLLRAELDGLGGSLGRAQRRRDKSLFFLWRSARTYMNHGCEIEAAKKFLTMAGTLGSFSEIQSAERASRFACRVLDRPTVSSKVRLAALHTHAHNLYRLGWGRAARRLYDSIQDLYDDIPGDHLQVRRPWLGGHLADLEGKLETAETLLRETRDRFLALDRPYGAAMLNKHIAILYAKQGRLRELEAVIDEIIPVFEEREVWVEADAARKILRDALGGRREVN